MHTFVSASQARCSGQSAHAPPVAPHAPTVVPATQVPSRQQPSWQRRVEEQAVVHRPVWESQAVPAGQSTPLVQPQRPGGRQTWPAASAVQSRHTVPAVPHAAGAVPIAQVSWAQQAPTHGCASSQEVVQVPAVPSQPVPSGQSPAVEHPQKPPPAVG